MDDSNREQAALVALLRARPAGLTWAQVTQEVLYAGSATQVWKDHHADTLLPDDSLLEEAAQDVDAWRQRGLQLVSILDAAYPRRLRAVHEAPPFLFTRGHLVPDDRGVSVVGSRDASTRGLQIARAVAELLVTMDLSVVSGLALGIDTAAHEATLAAGGRPVGVIGTGINRTYPAANADLHRRVADRGLLMSQFWPDAPPSKTSFPMRNAAMSGYGIATVVVEAGEQSGARIQARVAVGHGRPVLLSELVVHATTWGRDLVGRPRVHVVRGVEDVRRALDAVLADLGRADQVRQLVPPA